MNSLGLKRESSQRKKKEGKRTRSNAYSTDGCVEQLRNGNYCLKCYEVKVVSVLLIGHGSNCGSSY